MRWRFLMSVIALAFIVGLEGCASSAGPAARFAGTSPRSCFVALHWGSAIRAPALHRQMRALPQVPRSGEISRQGMAQLDGQDEPESEIVNRSRRNFSSAISICTAAEARPIRSLLEPQGCSRLFSARQVLECAALTALCGRGPNGNSGGGAPQSEDACRAFASPPTLMHKRKLASKFSFVQTAPTLV